MKTAAVNPTPGYLAWKADRDARIKRTGGVLPEFIAECGTHEGYLVHQQNGERSCTPCAVAHREWKEAKTPQTRKLKPCGTNAAYSRHIRRHEPVDEACAAAAREYKRSLTGSTPHKRAPCGTPAGNARHRREGTVVCRKCRDALNEKRREDREKKAKELEEK